MKFLDSEIEFINNLESAILTYDSAQSEMKANALNGVKKLCKEYFESFPQIPHELSDNKNFQILATERNKLKNLVDKLLANPSGHCVIKVMKASQIKRYQHLLNNF